MGTFTNIALITALRAEASALRLRADALDAQAEALEQPSDEWMPLAVAVERYGLVHKADKRKTKTKTDDGKIEIVLVPDTREDAVERAVRMLRDAAAREELSLGRHGLVLRSEIEKYLASKPARRSATAAPANDVKDEIAADAQRDAERYAARATRRATR